VELLPDALPLDGRHSLDRSLATGELSVIVNSPINFAGEEGSVTVAGPVPTGAPWMWPVLGGVLAAIGLHRLRRHDVAS
jgi:hypothetical protein